MFSPCCGPLLAVWRNGLLVSMQSWLPHDKGQVLVGESLEEVLPSCFEKVNDHCVLGR